MSEILQEADSRSLLDQKDKRVAMVAHTVGHGTKKDLELLQEDLWEAGFEPTLLRL